MGKHKNGHFKSASKAVQDHRQEALSAYNGKCALLKMREDAGIEDKDTERLRTIVKRKRIQLQNMGVLLYDSRSQRQNGN